MEKDTCLSGKAVMRMLKLSDREWKEFCIRDIFMISPGKRLTKNDMIDGDKPFIGASDSNNGITAFIANSNASEDNNTLGVNYNGSVVENFYHPYTCLFSDDVKRFKLKSIEGTKYHYLFFKTVILQQKCKYAYGYKFNEQRMQKQMILLPVNANKAPDYTFMEQYIKEREQLLVQNYISYLNKARQAEETIPTLKEKEWKEFYLKDIFPNIKRGKRLKTADHINGMTPYVSSSAINNGVDAFIGNNGKIRKSNDCLTVANSGSVGKTFYHNYEFIASDHVTTLSSDKLNAHSYLFVSVLVQRLEEKYNFNREINDSRINVERIVLPVDSSGNPDYDYMGKYAKNILLKLKLRYLSEKQKKC